MKYRSIFCILGLAAIASLTSSAQQFATGKASLGESLDSVKASLGSSFHFESHALSDPAIVVTVAYKGIEEAYALESLNGKIFYIEHRVYADTGFNVNDSITTLTQKYGGKPQSGNDSLFWGRSCAGQPANLTWPGGGLGYLASVKLDPACGVSAVYSPLTGRLGVVKQFPMGTVFGIQIKLLDPQIAIPEFRKMAALQQQQQQQKQADARAHQDKAPL